MEDKYFLCSVDTNNYSLCIANSLWELEMGEIRLEGFLSVRLCQASSACIIVTNPKTPAWVFGWVGCIKALRLHWCAKAFNCKGVILVLPLIYQFHVQHSVPSACQPTHLVLRRPWFQLKSLKNDENDWDTLVVPQINLNLAIFLHHFWIAIFDKFKDHKPMQHFPLQTVFVVASATCSIYVFGCCLYLQHFVTMFSYYTGHSHTYKHRADIMW